MENSRFALPPAANWFSSHILDVSTDHLVVYGSKNNLVFLKFPFDSGKNQTSWREKTVSGYKVVFCKWCEINVFLFSRNRFGRN